MESNRKKIDDEIMEENEDIKIKKVESDIDKSSLTSKMVEVLKEIYLTEGEYKKIEVLDKLNFKSPEHLIIIMRALEKIDVK